MLQSRPGANEKSIPSGLLAMSNIWLITVKQEITFFVFPLVHGLK